MALKGPLKKSEVSTCAKMWRTTLPIEICSPILSSLVLRPVNCSSKTTFVSYSSSFCSFNSWKKLYTRTHRQVDSHHVRVMTFTFYINKTSRTECFKMLFTYLGSLFEVIQISKFFFESLVIRFEFVNFIWLMSKRKKGLIFQLFFSVNVVFIYLDSLV